MPATNDIGHGLKTLLPKVDGLESDDDTILTVDVTHVVRSTVVTVRETVYSMRRLKAVQH